MVVGKLANMQQGARTDIAQIQAISQTEAADLLNVSRPSVQSARKVIEQAAPQIIEAVERGDLSVSLTAKATALPKD